MEVLLIVFFLVLAVGGIIGLARWLDKRRRQEWMVQALELDLNYQKFDANFSQRFSAFKLFNQGRNRRAKNILTGSQNGAEVVLADYYYVTGSGKNSHTHAQTVCLLRASGMSIPHFYLRRQMRLYDMLGKVFGGQDIDFTTDPEFSKAYVLQGRDPEATLKLFSPEVRRQLLRFRDTSIQLEGLGNTLLLHFGRAIKPNEANSLLEKAFFCLGLFERKG